VYITIGSKKLVLICYIYIVRLKLQGGHFTIMHEVSVTYLYLLHITEKLGLNYKGGKEQGGTLKYNILLTLLTLRGKTYRLESTLICFLVEQENMNRKNEKREREQKEDQGSKQKMGARKVNRQYPTLP
jgi:hypothetical protein